MNLLRAWITLVALSFRRLALGVNTLVIITPLAIAALFVWRRQDRIARTAEVDLDLAFRLFSERFVLFLFFGVLLPLCAIAYGATSLSSDREDRTLLFVLMRPIPRWLVLVAKWSASAPLVLCVVTMSFWLYCQLAGEVGQIAFRAYLPAVLLTALAYTGLFHIFAVLFKHSTILALAYALFMEFFIGAMPGIIKQFTVSYYGRSMVFAAGLEYGLPSPDPRWFQPCGFLYASAILLAVGIGGMLVSAWAFHQREFRDLAD